MTTCINASVFGVFLNPLPGNIVVNVKDCAAKNVIELKCINLKRLHNIEKSYAFVDLSIITEYYGMPSYQRYISL